MFESLSKSFNNWLKLSPEEMEILKKNLKPETYRLIEINNNDEKVEKREVSMDGVGETLIGNIIRIFLF